MPQHEVNFKPNPLQNQFITSRAKADLFSSRRGEGKSSALAWAALYYTRHNPGGNCVLIRDTFENIQATTQKTFFEWFPPGIFGSYNGSKKEYTWASGIADGTVTFLGLDTPDDASKLQSREFGMMGLDEVAPAIGSGGIDEMIFDVGYSSLRQKGMNWYAAKLVENNPDESHWTYRRFVQPGEEGFALWQPSVPENIHNLPPGYYAELRRQWAHRPDLVKRMVDGEFGFLQVGRSVTPQWNDKLHLTHSLVPLPRRDLFLCWDFGLNPTCLITQRTPLGHWNILDAFVGEGIGVEELIEGPVRAILLDRYKNLQCDMRHIGDPQGEQREQTSSSLSAVRSIKRMLGGTWRKGPVKIPERLEPLRAALTKTVGGRGLIQVDKERAASVWHALRGGWHYNVARTGLVSTVPFKNIHSHPGDALSYGAAILFPMGRLQQQGDMQKALDKNAPGGYFGGERSTGRVGAAGALARVGKPVPAGVPYPQHGDKP